MIPPPIPDYYYELAKYKRPTDTMVCVSAWNKGTQALLDVCVFSTPVNSLLLPNVRGCLDELAKRWGPAWKDQSGQKTRPIVIPGITRTADAPEARQKRVDTMTEPLQAVVRTLRPDLDDEGMAMVVETFMALRDRAIVRREKTKRSP